jgi:hypothetical protein
MLFNSEINYTNPAAVGHINPFIHQWVPGWVGVGTFAYGPPNVGRGQNLRGYLGPHIGIGFYTTKISSLQSIFNHNTYSNPCSALKFYK